MSANEIDAHVGLQMRKRREALGISQGRLGRHLGLTFSQIQKYEKGTNRIGAGRLYQIASFLGVPPSHFFEGIDGDDGAASGAGGQRQRPARRVPDAERGLRGDPRRRDPRLGAGAGPLAGRRRRARRATRRIALSPVDPAAGPA